MWKKRHIYNSKTLLVFANIGGVFQPNIRMPGIKHAYPLKQGVLSRALDAFQKGGPIYRKIKLTRRLQLQATVKRFLFDLQRPTMTFKVNIF